MNPCELVKSSCALVCSSSITTTICKINHDKLDAFVNSLSCGKDEVIQWDASGWHLNPISTGDFAAAQYCLVLDALNFCFWPVKSLEYEHLACGLRDAYLLDSHCFDADRLCKCDEELIKKWVSKPSTLPNLSERVTRIREVGNVLASLYGGSVLNLIAAANHSAVELVRLVTSSFPGFRDEALFQGRPVYFYKRAQIFVGDIWGCFGRQVTGQHPAAFVDMNQLTCFADYRIPQLLRHHNVILYSNELSSKVDCMIELNAGGIEEIAIRANTVLAVELIREKLKIEYSVTCDWLLWQKGEEDKDLFKPHHRVLTIFY
jgi:hypothetical protein